MQDYLTFLRQGTVIFLYVACSHRKSDMGGPLRLEFAPQMIQHPSQLGLKVIAPGKK